MKSGKVVILSGPSGVGKDTVIDAWIAKNSAVSRVVSYTTRAPREYEKSGVDYHFVHVSDYHSKAENGDFLEHKEVHGNWYATPLSDLKSMLSDGKIAILKIDVQGALHAMELLPEAISVFLLPPSQEELERRIIERGTESSEVIAKRLQNSREEIAMAMHYQHQIVNDDVAEMVRQLEEITK
jgi:guanylate kinase